MSGLVRFVLEPFSSKGTFSQPLEMAEMEEFCKKQQIGGTIWACSMIPVSSTRIEVDWNGAIKSLDDLDKAEGKNISAVSEQAEPISDGSVRTESVGGVVDLKKRGRGRPRKYLSESRDISS